MTVFRRKTGWRQYALAVALALIAFGIRGLLGTIIGDELPFMLFIAAALGAAWYGGAAAGFIALILGLVLAEHFFQAPNQMGGFPSLELLRFIRYVFTGALGVVLIGMLRRDRDRAKATAERLRIEVERRKRSEAELQEAKNLLSRQNEELERCVDERTAELSASIKSLEGILYHIAHNFRAPARTMEGFISLLESEYGQNWDGTAHDYANRVATGARHLERLIQDLLAYGRLTHVALRPININLEHVIDHVEAELSERIKTAKAEFTVDRPLPDVYADRDILNQVLFQLVDNAIKFVPAGTPPRIRIWTASHESTVRLWVQDNGAGIDPRYQKKIFLPFESQKAVAGYEGNGVGLAVVKQGTQRMGGCVGVESETGKGSRFWIELPTAKHFAESQELPTFRLSEYPS